MINIKYQENSLNIFKSSGAFTEGHFVLSRGDHSNLYVNKRKVFESVKDCETLAGFLATFYNENVFEIVVGVATGGILFSHLVAKALNKEGDLPAIWVEKDGDEFKFPQSWDTLTKGKRVLLVDDVISTGSSVKKALGLIRNAGGIVEDVAVLFNRGKVQAKDLGIKNLNYLIDYEIERWPEKECPLCKNGVPINTEVGHGKEFLAKTKRN